MKNQLRGIFLKLVLVQVSAAPLPYLYFDYAIVVAKELNRLLDGATVYTDYKT
jgi:hypothetical protein